MAHPLETAVRKAYEEFSRGNVDGYLAPCTEGFALSIPGKGGIAGTYVGKPGLWDLAGKAMTISGGTFTEEVLDVLANDNHAVVLTTHRFTRPGEPKEYRTTHLYEVVNGKLARCFELPHDAAVFNEAWGPSGA